MKPFAVLTVCLIWGDAVSAAQCPLVTHTTPPVKAMDGLRCSMMDRLREPESAKLRGVFLSRIKYIDSRHPDWEWVLCGEMTAKNGFGGMTGWQPFAYSPGSQKNDPRQRVFFNAEAYCGSDAQVVAGRR